MVSDAAGAVLPFRSVSVLLGKTPKPLQPGTRLRLCLFDLLALDGRGLTERRSRSASAYWSRASPRETPVWRPSPTAC